jgi:DMSO/TMAO reductase YedYZ molybdopterin-dependent catalytic subunit
MRTVTKTGRRIPWRALLAGALSGVLAAAVALGVAQLVAGLTGPLGSPVDAIGEVAINHTPDPVKEFAIAHFGSHDKDALVTGILVMLLGAAAVAGALAVRRLAVGLAVLALFGAAGVTAAVSQPAATAVDVLPVLAGIAVAAAALVALIHSARAAFPLSSLTVATERPPSPGNVAGTEPASAGAAWIPAGRRRFLLTGAGVAAVAAAGGGAGQLLLGRFSVASSRAQVRLPAPAVAARPIPAGARLAVNGISSFVTPNANFYRVDTDLVVPQVSPDSWTLRIDGMVARPVEITFGQLLRMPLTEADITLVCVSNVVGGPYAGNARWLGVPLAGLLRKAGIRAGADQVLSTGTDGMTISTPLQAILDGRHALVAVGMNGQPLPVAHGFPARMLVPGFYGYVSATKWLTRLTVTTFARQQAYWTQRGYAQQAPIKTESRIDVPKPLASLSAGRVPVAGVAWAPHRGIDAVEVSVDMGPWQRAQLAAADGIDTWRQWMWAWDAKPGLHSLRVRATDGTGATQASQEAGPVPNGSSGWDSVVVTVT